MMILALGGRLPEISQEEWKKEKTPAVFIANTTEAREAMRLAEMDYEGDITLEEIEFCKIETQQECLVGNLYIPRLSDVQGRRFQVMFFINQQHIVIIDNDKFSRRIIARIQQKRVHREESREHFLYSFMTQFMSRDLDTLGKYNRKLGDLEEKMLSGEADDFHNEMAPLRRELLLLRSYYDEMRDLGKELEEDENEFFEEDSLKFFGTIADRADRLMNRTVHLMEYAQQISDAYQSQVDTMQNKNMAFLTVMSTIFYPLTLITGWYGMNFRNMPELDSGYPSVIVLSLVVVGICILIFKKKKIL